MDMNVTLDQIQTFLVLADELHFGRTADRVFRSQSGISRLLSELEAEVGGKLVDRKSRNVRLTPAGSQLAAQLRRAMNMLQAAIDDARRMSVEISGMVRIGYTQTTAGATLHKLVSVFRDRHPEVEVIQRECPMMDPYARLRGDEVDVLVNWALSGEPDLTVGPILERQSRVVAVSRDHPFAARDHIEFEDLAGQPVGDPQGLPPSIRDAIVPATTPTGRAIPRRAEVGSATEIFALVSQGTIIHPTVDSMAELYPRPGVVFVPVVDMPPLPLGLIWVSANENATIRAVAEVAAQVFGEGRGAVPADVPT
jgi:DNA-binding transcriptional LysR family regulator